MSPIINTNFADMSEYEQLVNRLEHIDKAFIIRRHIKLHYAKNMPKEATQTYIKVIAEYNEFFNTFEESLLWFISVEIHSRFLAGSKKGLYRFICNLDNNIRENYKDKLSNISYKHREAICHIATQRNKYFAHADNVDWNQFPNLFDKELEDLISDFKKILNQIGEDTNEPRRVTTTQNLAVNQTAKLFDDLLIVLEPTCNIDNIRKSYDTGVKEFLKL